MADQPPPGVAYQTTEPGRTPAAIPGGRQRGAGRRARHAQGGAVATRRRPPKRGFVVFVDTAPRIVIDLTAVDGLQPGQMLSLRRDRIPIVHPVTGEALGELDDEVATARVIETRDRFSVAEIQSVAAGAQVQIKDRVVLK